ncbi:hypothetical protein A2732_02395 [Candidatus Nomurabacteria bacterium RIFCSPHIGHO2_01_FULL_40_10]|nr:MAG: hypothetical protein A2732_02395 [Candidatus Nomurabacteria bacterium RIFCSPHIGHO2_01_FULL_40_10]
MEVKYLQKQYDRFLSQVKEEAKDLYWLYNFFFIIESALVGALLVGKIVPDYLFKAQISGLILALYWFMIVHKQRLWRNSLIQRIQKIEEVLKYENDFQMWPPKPQGAGFFREYILGKRGLWRSLFLLPLGFAIFWLMLIF